VTRVEDVKHSKETSVRFGQTGRPISLVFCLRGARIGAGGEFGIFCVFPPAMRLALKLALIQRQWPFPHPNWNPHSELDSSDLRKVIDLNEFYRNARDPIVLSTVSGSTPSVRNLALLT